jgi:hypothetical protein
LIGAREAVTGIRLMAKLTLRYIEGEFVISGPDIQPVSFPSRREAKDWCFKHYRGLPLMEVGEGARKGQLDRRRKRVTAAQNRRTQGGS